jgi:hypothetical protein
MASISRIAFCLLFLICYSVSSFPQYKVFGTVTNGGNKETGTNYQVSGNLGQTGITKSTSGSYAVGGGFWQMLGTGQTINYPATIPVVVTFAFGDPKLTGSYRIIGLPGNNNLPLSNFMTGSPGVQGDWRAFRDPGSGNYIEYSTGDAGFNFQPGKAFWVVSKNPVNVNFPQVNSVPLAADFSYTFNLQSEWNLISNPFGKAIPWNDIKNINPAVTQPIHYYEGSYSQPSVMEPYKGYYLYNSGNAASLKIPFSTEGNLQKITSPPEQSLTIKLSGSNVEHSVVLGFSDAASAGVDQLDIFSPPSGFLDVNLEIFNNNLETNYKLLQKDIRRIPKDGEEFHIHLKNESGSPLFISADGIDNFTVYEIYLLDNNLIKFHNLKTSSNISSRQGNNMYTLFIGSSNYIEQMKSVHLPSEFTLLQNYPNPFNPSTLIRFSLPQQSTVSLTVFNMLGEVITVLAADQPYEPGYHEVEFQGKSAASGVYLYRLQVNTPAGVKFEQTKKMLILK